jgi:hypothetical protein
MNFTLLTDYNYNTININKILFLIPVMSKTENLCSHKFSVSEPSQRINEVFIQIVKYFRVQCQKCN